MGHIKLSEEERAARVEQWHAIRPNIVPRQLLDPLVVFEEQLRIVEPLLNPEARKTKSFVARFSECPDAASTRASFEQVVAAAEKLCRHARKEKSRNREYYDQTVLQPKLDRLTDPPRDEARERVHGISPGGYKHGAQRALLQQLHTNLQDYAKGFGERVNADKLWNAYRLDFRGLDTKQLEVHPFAEAFPATMHILRSLARVHRLERVARVFAGGSQEQIIAEAVKLREALPENDVLRSGVRGEQLDVLANGVPRPFSHQLFTEQDEAKSEIETAKFGDSLSRFIKAMTDEIATRNRYLGKAGCTSMQRLECTQQFQEALLDAYTTDVRALRKKDAKGDVSNQEAINTTLRSAPHIEPMISYLRAQAALKKFDAVLEKYDRAIIGLYDAPVTGRAT